MTLVLRAECTVVMPVVAGFEAALDPGSLPTFNQFTRLSWVISKVFFTVLLVRTDLRTTEVSLLALIVLLSLVSVRLAALVFFWALKASILRGGKRPHK